MLLDELYTYLEFFDACSMSEQAFLLSDDFKSTLREVSNIYGEILDSLARSTRD